MDDPTEYLDNGDTQSDEEKLIKKPKQNKDTKIIILGTKKKRKKKKKELYKEIELSREEVEEQRSEARLKEDYVNAMFKCERCILSFSSTEDLQDHLSLKHGVSLHYYLFFFRAEPFSSCHCPVSHGVWLCARLMAIGSPPITWDIYHN